MPSNISSNQKHSHISPQNYESTLGNEIDSIHTMDLESGIHEKLETTTEKQKSNAIADIDTS